MDDSPNLGPLVANELVFIASQYSSLYAIDARTGEKKWEFGRRTEFVMIDGIGYAGTDRGLKSFNAITGETNWQFEPPFPKNVDDTDKYSELNPFGKKIAVANGFVYARTRKQNKLYALDETNGNECWEFSL